ncbi:unnamed protein product [Arctogadus glacialis]
MYKDKSHGGNSTLNRMESTCSQWDQFAPSWSRLSPRGSSEDQPGCRRLICVLSACVLSSDDPSGSGPVAVHPGVESYTATRRVLSGTVQGLPFKKIQKRNAQRRLSVQDAPG